MIPKIIHYVWVGDNPKSELINKCIHSWKKYCPNYTIMEWNNDTIKEIKNDYLHEAFNCKKWAFVSDYLRLYALNKYGGFYFDTDLELTQSIEKFTNADFITGYENWEGHVSPITALMGATPKSPIIQDLLDEYKKIHFVHNGKLDLTTNVTRISKYFEKKFNLTPPYNGNITTKISDKAFIYPSYFFCTPKSGQENYSIHHFNGSWVEPCIRKIIISTSKWRIIKFKNRESHINQGEPFFLTNEKVVILKRIGKNKIFALVKIRDDK